MVLISKKYIFFTNLLFVMILASCNHDKYSDLIDRAETLIEVDGNPDEALSLLHGVCFDSIKSDKNKARYGYLYARSMHKTWQKMNSDLFIKQSVDYYQSKGDLIEQMKSLFYYSNYLYENGFNEAAVRALMKSRSLAINLRDDYWRAKTSELMGEILCGNHNNHEAIKFNTEAAEYYYRAGREDNARYSYLDLSINYGNIFDYERCFELIDSIKRIAEVENDSSLLSYCFYTEYRFKFKNKEYEKAKNSLDKYFAMNDYIKATAGDSAYKSWLCVLNKDYDSAKIILSKLIPEKYDNSTKAIIYFAYRDLNKMLGNYQEALRYSDSIMICSDNDTRVASSQLLVAAQRDYLDEGLRFAEMKSKEQRKLLVLVGVIAFFIVLFIVLFYQYRLKVKRLESERKINDIMLIFNDINHKNHELEVTVKNQEQTLTDMGVQIESVDELRMRLRELYRNQWTLLNSLCYEYFEKRDSDKFRSYMFNRIESELQKFKSQLSNKQITESTDRYLDGLASKFIEQCGFLNDVEQRFVLMVFVGFSPRAICLFMGFKQKNFYAKKKQIMMKISESDAPDRDLFLRYLE